MKLCDACGQGQATVYVVDLINGASTQRYICNQCAVKMNIVPQHFQIENIFKEILAPFQKQQIEDVKCGDCGMTYSGFKKNLRFGCAHDYDLFNVSAMLNQIHGTDKHVGKSPKSRPDYTKIRGELQTKLDTAVKSEDYESAAKLRDQIKLLPKGD